MGHEPPEGIDDRREPSIRPVGTSVETTTTAADDGAETGPSESASPVSNAKATTLMSLEEISASIRERLARLASRVDAARTTIKALNARLKPLVETRKVVLQMRAGDHPGLNELAGRRRDSVARARAVIDASTVEVASALELRRDLVAGLDRARGVAARQVVAPAERWSIELSELRGRYAAQIDELGPRIEAAERRWRPEESAGGPEEGP